jgi:hypothetical protein
MLEDTLKITPVLQKPFGGFLCAASVITRQVVKILFNI